MKNMAVCSIRGIIVCDEVIESYFKTPECDCRVYMHFSDQCVVMCIYKHCMTAQNCIGINTAVEKRMVRIPDTSLLRELGNSAQCPTNLRAA
jgi:hypothetical protein